MHRIHQTNGTGHAAGPRERGHRSDGAEAVPEAADARGIRARFVLRLALPAGEKPNPEFVLNHPRYKGASVLLARANFGCGSSREHAPWAILDYGFRAILAPSYADIFYNNCFKNGILPVTLSNEQIDELFKRTAANEGYTRDRRSRAAGGNRRQRPAIFLHRRSVPPRLPAQGPRRYRADARTRGRNHRV